MIAKTVGRLANRIILFANFIAAGAEHGFSVVNPAFLDYARYFPSTHGDLLCRFPTRFTLRPVPGSRRLVYRASATAAGALRLRQSGRSVGLIRLERDQYLDLNSPAFLEVVRDRRVVFVQGWFFRSETNCARHRGLICSYFTPWKRHLDGARAAVEPARARGGLVVGVHIRHGDFARFKGGRHFYSHEQYRRVMESVEAAFPTRDVSFLVCSDAAVPADAFAGLDIYRGNGHELEDLYALAACDRIIGPPSTYTAWASYYGEVPRYVIEDPAQPPGAGSFELNPGLSRGLRGSPWPSVA